MTHVRLGSHLSAALHPEVGTRVTATPVEWGLGCPAESPPQLLSCCRGWGGSGTVCTYFCPGVTFPILPLSDY